MSRMSLSDISNEMRDIDFAMLSTHTPSGDIAGRPMSTNGDVDYDGDSYFFALEHAHLISDIQQDPNVGLSFQGRKGLLGTPPVFISVEGTATLIRDKEQFAEHWTTGLNDWFEDGMDTPGLVLVKVHASRIHYWDGTDEGELRV
ncbi:MAG: pyridoxamine 5-phosphate oxidase [Microvirga sp.]|jgi:general stress protein 26|nr:pyridoxamine 5-phosphate oxidase [Microvirga sp.]